MTTTTTTATTWTAEQNAEAMRQGWAIFNDPDATNIQRDDEAAILDSDDEAWQLVANGELDGDPLHVAALAYVQATNPAHAGEIRNSILTGSFVFMVPVVVEIEAGSVVRVVVIDETSPEAGTRGPDDEIATKGNAELAADSCAFPPDPERDARFLRRLVNTANDGRDWPSWEFGF